MVATTPGGSVTGRSPPRSPTSAASGRRSPPGSCATSRKLTEAVEIGSDAPGFVRPSYGLGVMTDPGRPDGLLIGHGGGGPAAAAAFALVRERMGPLVAVELSGDERADVQATALDALREATTSG